MEESEMTAIIFTAAVATRPARQVDMALAGRTCETRTVINSAEERII
jgi:hypothetical protein